MYIIFQWLLFALISTSSSSVSAPVSLVPEATGDILFVSHDLGNSWSGLGKSLPSGTTGNSFLADPNTYLLATPKGLYSKHVLLPATWTKEQYPNYPVTHLFAGKNGTYAASVWDGLYYLQPSTGQWKKLSQNLHDKSIHSAIETRSGALLVNVAAGVFRSADKGASWQHVLTMPINKVLETKDAVLACGNGGIWRSTDEGQTWTRVQTNTTVATNLQSLKDRIISITQGQDLGGIVSNNIVHISNDHGAHWQPAQYVLPKELARIYDLQQSGNSLFACADKGIYRSDDNGSTWRPVLRIPASKGGFFKMTVNEAGVFALLVEGC